MTSPFPPEPLGQRIARERARLGWSQAELASRIAASRVAISHFELGLAVPSERTVVLLAGLFKREPHELVAGTDYPEAKRERLPAAAPRYTELELQLQLLDRDLDWLARESGPSAAELAAHWSAVLRQLEHGSASPRDRDRIRQAATRLQRAVSERLARRGAARHQPPAPSPADRSPSIRTGLE